jgi:hypothetical protein
MRERYCKFRARLSLGNRQGGAEVDLGAIGHKAEPLTRLGTWKYKIVIF